MTIKTLLLTLGVLAAPLLLQTAHAEAPAPVQGQNISQSVTLDMQNMTCALCKFTIKKALQGVEGVQKVNVDADAKTADVTFDPQKTGIEALIKATTHVGYPATARDGGSVAIDREPMRPTVHKK